MNPEPLHSHFPKPKRLIERPLRMTVIGALKTMDGVVLCADRQETYGDYAKWDVEKIKHFELGETYRLFMAGAGDADTIEMIWGEVLGSLTVEVPADNLKEHVIQCVRRVTKKSIFPCPYDERPRVNLIWVIQKLGQSATRAPWNRIEAFRTRALTVNEVSGPYFSGNPLLITRYLSDLHLRGLMWGIDEAQALAAYVLWEAKEYDPFCGKNSDIIVIKGDGGVRRLLRKEIKYWEEHFANLKGAFVIWPLLSCATERIQHSYAQGDHLARFKAVIKTLSKRQMEMRKDSGPEASKLERELIKNLRKASMQYWKKSLPVQPIKLSKSQKSEDQQ